MLLSMDPAGAGGGSWSSAPKLGIEGAHGQAPRQAGVQAATVGACVEGASVAVLKAARVLHVAGVVGHGAGANVQLQGTLDVSCAARGPYHRRPAWQQQALPHAQPKQAAGACRPAQDPIASGRELQESWRSLPSQKHHMTGLGLAVLVLHPTTVSCWAHLRDAQVHGRGPSAK